VVGRAGRYTILYPVVGREGCHTILYPMVAPGHGQVEVLEWAWDDLAIGLNVVAVAADIKPSAAVYSEKCCGERMSPLA
jgi:hypothetical protein